jgi:hypothetical protein
LGSATEAPELELPDGAEELTGAADDACDVPADALDAPTDDGAAVLVALEVAEPLEPPPVEDELLDELLLEELLAPPLELLELLELPSVPPVQAGPSPITTGTTTRNALRSRRMETP